MPDEPKTPNIFDYATSELSQDAFICWLVSWVNCDEDPVMQRCAKDFVALLYNTFEKSDISGEQVTAVENLRQQYFHIDVYFQAIVAGQRVSFVIEDKTHTTHHSEQLARYRDAVAADGEDEDKTVLIYFKTGYLHTRDKQVVEQGYRILNYKKTQAFLDAHKTDNEIFESYRRYFRATFYEPYEKRFPAFMAGNDIGLLQHWHVQWQFMEALKEKLRELPQATVGSARIDDTSNVYSGSNFGGSSWTQLRFATIEGVYGKEAETLFYRVDWRKGGYYLAIRQYANIDKGTYGQEKLARLRQYRELFKPLRQNGGSLVFGEPTTDNTGRKESEIAVLFLEHEGNAPQQVLDQLPAIHGEYVRRLGESARCRSA